MFIWGSGGDVVHIGPAKPRECPRCEKKRAFSLVLGYEYQHIYFLFGYVSKKQYAAVCDVCGYAKNLDARKVEGRLEKSPIPFMRRYGCLVFPLFVVAVFFLCVLMTAAPPGLR